MTKHIIPVAFLAVLFAGCAAEQFSTTTVLASSASWQLHVDPVTGGLIDTRCAGGGDCSVHQNPFECVSMNVSVSPNGELCGRCDGGTMRVPEACGGFSAGLPYDCSVRLEGTAACVVCADLRGQERYRNCSGAPAIMNPTVPGGTTPGVPGRAGCLDLHDKLNGNPCQICLNDSGNVVSNTCSVGTGGGDIAPVDPNGPNGPGGPGDPSDPSNPINPDDPNDGTTPGQPDDGGDVTGVVPGVPPAPDPCLPNYRIGSQAFVNEMNAIFGEARLTPPLLPGAASPDPGTLVFNSSNLSMCNSNHEWEELEEWSSHLPGRHDIDNIWTRNFGTSVRCYIMVQIAAERAYKPPCERGDQCLDAFIAGTQAELAVALNTLQSRYSCVGSPIVLDLDGNGIRSELGHAQFDLTGSGARTPTSWIARGDALLARDIDGDGRISSVYELFGDLTPDGPTSDGYVVLRTLDENGDGFVDARDPAFGELLLWADDGDGISTSDELARLADTDIVRLNAAAVAAPAQDGAGSELAFWSSFERADGSTGATCDIFFADGTP